LTKKGKISSFQINESNGFRLFASLIQQLGDSNSTQVKIQLLTEYFSTAPDADKTWTIALFTGRKLKRMVKTSLLSAWVSELKNLPAWLFEECYHQVGDLEETLALLLPQQKLIPQEGDLADYLRVMKTLEKASDEEKKESIVSCWNGMNDSERFVFNKLITGGFRIGVPAQLVIQSLARLLNEEPAILAHRLSGKWDPDTITFDQLVLGLGSEDNLSQPYPFFLAHGLVESLTTLGDPSQWQAEWKWDGIRGQVIKRKGQWFVWSRGEELITDKFPEFDEWRSILPDGLVLDGEILAMKESKPLPFALLQTRIGRIKVSKRQLSEAPVHFIAFDLLEFEGEDWRSKELHERRKKLEEVISNIGHPSLLLSNGIGFTAWDELSAHRLTSRENGSEGLMLKRNNSTYQVGRKSGDWWKWKTDPLTIDAVLIYAQKGHGRRSNLYTDYTFAVRDGDRLVSFAKAYSGLTDNEFIAVDAFVKKNAVEKFGPVRTVKPELIFEIAFEGISESKRHKSGITVRFPRMNKWRTDKKVEDINTLDDLKELLHALTAKK
jgi:DNA ligase-1